MNKRRLYYLLSPKLRRLFRRVYYLPIDFVEAFFRNRDKLIPPKGKIFIGRGDFKAQGEKLMSQLVKYANLQPNHRVLDIGCGIGRLAVPLTNYLNEEGSYEGFDIVKPGIEWCNKNIGRSYSNFKFKHIDLKNDLYNLKTREEAKNFVFPYKDKEFDLAFLFSVFTHMIPEDVDNYLSEIYRVLKKGGRCFATFFILNTESKELMTQGHGLNFKYNKGNHFLIDKKVKEANVAYQEDFLRSLLTQKKFKIEKISCGYWPGKCREDCIDFQDTVIIIK